MGKTFTLGQRTVAFAAPMDGAIPDEQVIAVTVRSGDVESMAYGFEGVPEPTWLGIDFSGDFPNLELRLFVSSTSLPKGRHHTTLTLASEDASESELERQTIDITLDVSDPFKVTSAPIGVTRVIGSSEPVPTGRVEVSAEGRQWTATTDAPWLTIPSQIFTGSSGFDVIVDPTGLEPGTHAADVIVTSQDSPPVTAVANTYVFVQLPHFSTSLGGLVFGGYPFGTMDPKEVVMSLNTGSRRYPWTATVHTDDGAAWFAIDRDHGTVGSEGQAFVGTFDRSRIPGGFFLGGVTLATKIEGYDISTDLQVSAAVEADHLRASRSGVLLSRLPGRGGLSEALDIETVLGRPGVRWIATSDQAWLAVTASGATGEPMTLTVDPAQLTPDTPYVANVTLTGQEPAIEGAEVVRVGAWITATAPQDLNLDVPAREILADPVLPYAYLHAGDDRIQVRNLYTGNVVRTLVLSGSQLGAMTISGDGTRLYVTDEKNAKIIALDPVTGKVSRRFAGLAGGKPRIAYARPNAHPVLATGEGRVYDGITGQVVLEDLEGAILAGSPDGQFVFGQTVGSDPHSLSATHFLYSVIGGGHFEVASRAQSTEAGVAADVAIAADGRHVYSASSTPNVFHVAETAELARQSVLPAGPDPNNVEVAPDGLMVGGSGGVSAGPNIWVFDPDGIRRQTLQGPGGHLRPRTLRVSPDSTRIVVSSDTGKLGLRTLAPPP